MCRYLLMMRREKAIDVVGFVPLTFFAIFLHIFVPRAASLAAGRLRLAI